MFQTILLSRSGLQDELLAASCYIPDSVNDEDLKQTRKRNLKDPLVRRFVCKYCEQKFATNAQGLGIPMLTDGCKRGDYGIGSREHTKLLRRWRRNDSNSKLKGICIGIEEPYGCISCCLCTVCISQFVLIDAQISNKKSKDSSVQLPEEEHIENNYAYNDDYDVDYDIMDIVPIGKIGATQMDYLNAIYGPNKGSHTLLELIRGYQYSFPRAYLSNDNDDNDDNDENEYDDDATEITTFWPEKSNGFRRSTLQFSSEQTNRKQLSFSLPLGIKIFFWLQWDY